MDLLWDNIYSVGVEEIDEQHKKLFLILNTLLGDIKKREYNKNLSKVISELIDYSNYHFKTEEEYFKKFNYHDADSHIKKHQDFRAKIMSMSQNYKDDELEAVYSLVDYLEDWFIDHINGTDKRYTELFHAKGLK